MEEESSMVNGDVYYLKPVAKLFLLSEGIMRKLGFANNDCENAMRGGRTDKRWGVKLAKRGLIVSFSQLNPFILLIIVRHLCCRCVRGRVQR